jgi:chorismate synthase
MKGVEIGLGFQTARLSGSQVHDAFNVGKESQDAISQDESLSRPTNNAGGLEGGVTNGEPLVCRVAMKPISTLMKALPSVNVTTGQPTGAHVERSDYCAVPAAGVVGEAMVAIVLADAMLEKFGGDTLEEMRESLSRHREYCARWASPRIDSRRLGASINTVNRFSSLSIVALFILASFDGAAHASSTRIPGRGRLRLGLWLRYGVGRAQRLSRTTPDFGDWIAAAQLLVALPCRGWACALAMNWRAVSMPLWGTPRHARKLQMRCSTKGLRPHDLVVATRVLSRHRRNALSLSCAHRLIKTHRRHTEIAQRTA